MIAATRTRVTALGIVTLLLAACGSEPARPSRAHVTHREPVSTTPAAEAAAGVSTSAALSTATPRATRAKPASTWDSAQLPQSWPDQDAPPHPGEIPADVINIPDAVPQFELRSAFGNPDSYEVYGKKYVVLDDASNFRERGRASWYGKKFHGKKTSSGEPYDMFAMTGAHKTLPLPCYARVTNTDNGKSVIVKINDRGPFHDGRIVDLSYAAAAKLGMLGYGSIPVELEVVTPQLRPADPPVLLASAPPATKAAMVAASAPVSTVAPASAPASVSRPVAPPPAPTMTAAPAVSQPVVVASASPAPVATSALAPPPVPRFDNRLSTARFLQAGLFTDPVNAVGLRDQLTGMGIDGRDVVMRSEDRGSGFAYRVLIGPFNDTAVLESMRTRLAAARLASVPVSE